MTTSEMRAWTAELEIDGKGYIVTLLGVTLGYFGKRSPLGAAVERALATPSVASPQEETRALAICKAVLKKIHEWRQIGSDPEVLLESRNLHAELADEMEKVFDSAEPPTSICESFDTQGHTTDYCTLSKGHIGPHWGKIWNWQAAAPVGEPERTPLPVKTWPDGVPCDHPGCLSHVSHPCEGCGRIAGRAAPPAQGAPTPRMVTVRNKKTGEVQSHYKLPDDVLSEGWEELAAQGAPGTREALTPATEMLIRMFLWEGHGHSGPALYGDDGEMQCKRCKYWDYKRDSLNVLVEQARQAALAIGLANQAAPTNEGPQ